MMIEDESAMAHRQVQLESWNATSVTVTYPSLTTNKVFSWWYLTDGMDKC
jgi:hypothetical protein